MIGNFQPDLGACEFANQSVRIRAELGVKAAQPADSMPALVGNTSERYRLLVRGWPPAPGRAARRQIIL